MSKIIAIDFEFNHTTEKLVNLVCCSCREGDEVKSFWLLNDDGAKAELKEYLQDRKDTHYFMAYAVIAEASAFLSLGIEDVAEYKWVDLYVEYRALLNHNHHMMYGKQLIDGREVRTFPPKNKYEQTAEDKNRSNQKPQASMAAAAYKLLGIKLDTNHKTEMRDIIIASNDEDIIESKVPISDYCDSDTKYLVPMWKAMKKEYKRLLRPDDFKNLTAHATWRGEYAARTAMVSKLGYPIQYQSTKNFSDSVPTILRDIQMEINELFPDIKPFRFNKRTTSALNGNTFSWNQKSTKEWIKTLDPKIVSSWKRTAKKDFSLSVDAFLQFYNYHHNFPKDNFGAQMVRYLKAKQQLNGFMPSKAGKRNFWDSVGTDHRSRPFLGIYGSQSSRNQPAATGFLFLKSAWLRSLCVPLPGRAICGCDFSSEEFLIAALESGDKKMIEAYHSGDPYLAFAKDAGAAPKDATKASHGPIRDRFKSTVLGVSYLMGAKSLALKLTADTGTYHTEEEAQDLIDLFADVYSVYDDYRNDIVEEYYADGYLMLDDGWPLFGDNDNFRSIANCPIQGMGGVVLRRAVKYAQEAGLDVILTLHDALYAEYDSDDLAAVDTLMDAMKRAFKDCYKGSPMYDIANIRVDADVWSPDYKGVSKLTTPLGVEVKAQEIYIDGRAVVEYNTFSQYFTNNVEELERLL